MKKSIGLSLLTAALVCNLPASRAAEGAKDKPPHNPKSEHRPKQTAFRGKVSAVDKTNKTVTLEGKEKSRTFQITSSSKILRDGKPAVMDDVIVGETVGGLAREIAGGKWEVVTLSVGAQARKPKAEKPPKQDSQ